MQYDKNSLTRENAIWFMDMIDSILSPNYVPRTNRKKPYKKFIADKNSDFCFRFIELYTLMNYILTDREIMILDELYGVYKEKASLVEVGRKLAISPERVRQIRSTAEFKLAREMKRYFNI